MPKLDKLLITLFFIYILWLGCLFLYKFLLVKDTVIKEEVKEIESIEETYVFYENKTYNNMLGLKNFIYKNLKWLKTQIIDNNNKLIKSERLKSDYFNFYIKYKNEIFFLEFLKENKIYLQDFEKKYILWHLWYNDKIFNSIKYNKMLEFRTSGTLIWDKKILFDKEKEIIRVQTFDEDEQQWMNIYYWELWFSNIDNEYVYKMDFINKNEDTIYWIIYFINKEFQISHHFINIKYQENIITRITNMDLYNEIDQVYLAPDCNQKLKYLSINPEKTKMSVYCKESRTWSIKIKDIIDNNKK